jgi:biotin carboxyl carrier protein
MTTDVEVNGRKWPVSVEPLAGASHRYVVTIDGARVVVDAVPVDADTLSVILPEEGSTSCTVGFAVDPVAGVLLVSALGATMSVAANGARSRRRGGLAAVSGEQRVVAPMPGKVLRVLVAPGEAVAVRQPLVVIEAMKMENELTALRPGRVKEVAVAAGESVEAGRLLVTVE